MVWITGDTHGRIDFEKLSIKKWPSQQNLTKSDYLIICGDFGGVWFGANPRNARDSSKDDALLNEYEAKPFTTLFVDGNHENHAELNKYPISEWHGGKVHKVRDGVIHLMRGQVFAIDGATFFTMGGARSTDIKYRQPNISWWEAELPTKEEWEVAFINLTAHDNTVDYIITHQAPLDILLRHYKRIPHAAEFEHLGYLNKIDDTVNFKHWYFGHLHNDEEIDTRHTAMFDKVRCIEE
jgi:predicted phosphodiesterase